MYKKIIIIFRWIIPLLFCGFFSYSIVVGTSRITVFSRKQTISISRLYPEKPSLIVATYDYRGLPIPFSKRNPDTENIAAWRPEQDYYRFYLTFYFIDIAIVTVILMLAFKKMLEKIKNASVFIRFMFSIFYIILALFPAIDKILFGPHQFLHPRFSDFISIKYDTWKDLITSLIIQSTVIGIPLIIIVSNVSIMFRRKVGRLIHLYLVWPYTLFSICYCFLDSSYVFPELANLLDLDLVFYNIVLFFLIMASGSTFYLTRPKTKEQFN